MTVKELSDFLLDYNNECQVYMLQHSNDNPLSDTIEIKKVIGIDDNEGNGCIVLIPK